MMKFLSRSNNLWFLSITLLVFSFQGYSSTPDPPVKFIENKNQWASDVHFSAAIPGGKMVIGAGKFAYYFLDGDHIERLHEQAHSAVSPDAAVNWNVRSHTLLVDFIAANISSSPLPFGRSTEYYNYYLGADAKKWASQAYAYDGMIYPNIYRDINLKVYAAGENLKYDFIVAPYGDPSQIIFQYSGADRVEIINGDLVVKTSLADIIEKQPLAYQLINGERIIVESSYELSNNRVSFCFPKGYDPCYELVIDPLLIFSTYSGSTADNWGSTATPGEHGTLYSAGVTNQTTFGGSFPATTGAFQTQYGGIYDIGILKYDSTGGSLMYATFLGGNQSESPHSLVINSNEELIILGTTSSLNYPTTLNAFDKNFSGGPNVSHVVNYENGSDIVVSRISKDGTQLLGSTFLGGSENDGLNKRNGGLVRNYGDELRGDIITDVDGNIYISSVTASSDIFSSITGFDQTYNGGDTDAILLKLSADLSGIIWGTYIGGAEADASHTLKLDSQRNIFIAGGTNSPDFPMPPGGQKPIKSGSEDGWIMKIAADGAALLNGTFTGTSSFDQVYFLDLNADEEVYVYGQTAGGLSFPVTPGVYNNRNSGQFLQKFNNALSTLVFSTVFGSGSGVPDISPTAFLVNECNNIYMTGWGGEVNSRNSFWNNNTVGMPVSEDAFQRTTSGSDFYFMVLTDNATRFLYGTYLGGSQSRTHVDGGTSRFDKGGVVYHAVCSGCSAYNATNRSTSDFPTTRGAWSRTNRSSNCNNAAFKFDLSSLKARLQTNSVKRNMPGLKFVCMPDKIVFENFSTGGEIFQWDLGDGTTIVKTDTSAITHQYQNTGQYLVKLKAIDQGTCKAVDSTFTVVSVYEIHAEVQQDDDLCEGDSYKLSSRGGIIYEWKNINGDVVSNEATPTMMPADTTDYFVTITNQDGCVHRDTVRLNVVPNVNPEFELFNITDCFTRSRIRVNSLTDSLKADDILFFDYGDGNTTDLSSDEHHYEKDGVYQVRLVGARSGCVFEKKVNVPVYSIAIPNVITPGAPEGLNDKLTVRYGEIDGITPADFGFRVSLIIYNRWGRMLYRNDDYQYDWSGEGLAAGVYYYEISIEGHSNCKSWLHLIR